jgi:hypothetical protein
MKGVVKKAFELYQAALPIMESQRLVMFGAILDCLDDYGKDELITSPLYARLKANGDPIGLIRLIQNIFPNNGVNTSEENLSFNARTRFLMCAQQPNESITQ